METKPDTNSAVSRISWIREQARLLVERELRRRGINNVLPPHGGILFFLFSREEAVPMKEIVERLDRVKSTVTGMVSTLEKGGYVEKFRCPDDGRVILVRLTPKGRALQQPFEEISEILQQKVYGDMPESDRQTLVQLLAQVQANLKHKEER